MIRSLFFFSQIRIRLRFCSLSFFGNCSLSCCQIFRLLMRHVEQLIKHLHPNRFLVGFRERPHRFPALTITLHVLAGWCAIQLASKKASVSASKASVSIGATAPPPERRVPSTSHRRVVPSCGRDVPPQAPGSGEASPHTPPPTAEPASPLRSDPPKGRLHCAAMLSLCSVRTLPKGRLHCTSLTVCAGSRGGFSPQSCSADVFRPGIHASCM